MEEIEHDAKAPYHIRPCFQWVSIARTKHCISVVSQAFVANNTCFQKAFTKYFGGLVSHASFIEIYFSQSDARQLSVVLPGTNYLSNLCSSRDAR
jgi:hypothetical protein